MDEERQCWLFNEGGGGELTGAGQGISEGKLRLTDEDEERSKTNLSSPNKTSQLLTTLLSRRSHKINPLPSQS